MADQSKIKPSTKPGILGTYENYGKGRQQRLNAALGDNLKPRKLGQKPKKQRNQSSGGD